MAKSKLPSEDKLPRGIFMRNGIYWIRYADANGKLRREPGGGTVRNAQSKLTLRRGQKLEGKAPVLRSDRLKQKRESNIGTFGEWITEAVDHHKKHSGEKHAYDFERKCIYIGAQFGALPISQVKRATILDWMEEAAAGGVTGDEEWGAANWNRYHSCFSSIFELAAERAIAEGQEPPLNPMKYIRRRTEHHKERYWSENEDTAIIDATQKLFPKTGYEDIFILAEEVGYRKSEQLRAIVGDYNPETHKITVRQRKTKSAGPFRYVPLSDRGVAAYERLSQGRKPGEPLLTNKLKYKSQPMEDVRYWFEDVLKEAGITDEDASWHVCRHTFCSRAVAKGVPPTDVKEYAGHSDIRTTMKYTHGIEGISDVQNREAMNGKRKSTQPDVASLQKQIAELTALVQQLKPRD
jgi:integrase